MQEIMDYLDDLSDQYVAEQPYGYETVLEAIDDIATFVAVLMDKQR